MNIRHIAGALLCAFVFTILAGPASAAEYPPGLMFSTVLNGVKLLPKSGQFRDPRLFVRRKVKIPESGIW